MTDLPFDPDKMPDPNFDPALHVPDLMEAVEGWRAWRVEIELPPHGLPPKLYSATHGDYFWVPRRTALAECRTCGQNVPGESCACGFYSAKSLDHLMTMGYHTYNTESGMCCVIGQVANWGKVIEGTQGWRAAKAYPKQLWVPFECWKLAKALEEAYGVPVGLKNFLQPAKAAM